MNSSSDNASRSTALHRKAPFPSSRIGHRLVQRSLRFADKHKYAPLAAAGTAAVAVFWAGAGICSIIGIKAGPIQFLALGIISFATFVVIHSVLLYRSRAQLESIARSTPVFEVRRQLDQLLPQLGHDTAGTIQDILTKYETEIKRLQDDLTRLTHRDIPGRPVTIESGSFFMGSDDGEPDERPQHSVFVSAFLIERYPITNRQFLDFVSDPSNENWSSAGVYQRYGIPYYLSDWDALVPPHGKWDHPVVNVSWFAAVGFCNWRSELEGRSPVYSFVDDFHVKPDFSKDGWRLPTEAEWEKAARGGLSRLRYPWVGHLTPALANYGKHHRGTTPVGQFPANDFGVFDMLGNVKEWCHDTYSKTAYADRGHETPRDPCGLDAGSFRVFRGGSWMDQGEWIHLTKRGRMYAQNVNPDFGFRCVRKP